LVTQRWRTERRGGGGGGGRRGREGRREEEEVGQLKGRRKQLDFFGSRIPEDFLFSIFLGNPSLALHPESGKP